MEMQFEWINDIEAGFTLRTSPDRLEHELTLELELS